MSSPAVDPRLELRAKILDQARQRFESLTWGDGVNLTEELIDAAVQVAGDEIERLRDENEQEAEDVATRLRQMAAEWRRGVEFSEDDGGLSDWQEGKVAGYTSCARDLRDYLEYLDAR